METEQHFQPLSCVSISRAGSARVCPRLGREKRLGKLGDKLGDKFQELVTGKTKNL